MKLKIIVINLLVAIVAAFIAIFAYSRISEPVKEIVTYREEPRNWFTSLPADFKADQFDFTYAAEKTVHGVVHVRVRSQGNRGAQDPVYEFFFGPRREPRTVEGFGSGVIISDDGYIVTNNHVIQGATSIDVILNDRREYSARVVGADSQTDIALLKIEEKNLPYIEWGDSDQLRIGQWVLAVGNPMNLTSTVTAGIVSAKGRGVGIINDSIPIESFIQTDAAVNRGNSGGALVDLKGQLVGVPTLIMSPTGSFIGNSFAVPVSLVRKVVEDIIEYGEVQRALLGVRISALDAEMARELGLDRIEGVFVGEATEGGAAREAGLRRGDVITGVNGVRINSEFELQEQIGRLRPGDSVVITAIRNKQAQQFTAVLRNVRGNVDIVKTEEAYLGIRFAEVNRNTRRQLNIPAGIQIRDIGPGPFLSAGLREGFIIVTINDKQVNSVEDVKQILDGHSGGVYIQGIYPNGTVSYYAFGL